MPLPSSKTLTFKMRKSAQPFLWKWVLFAWEWKTISISKAAQLITFWYRGPGNSEMTYRVHLTRSQSSLNFLLMDTLRWVRRLRVRDFLIVLYQVVHAREPAGGEARKYQELTFGFPCTEQPLARTRTRQKPLRRKWKVKKLALVWNQVVGLASTDKTNWRINLRFWEIVHLPLP